MRATLPVTVLVPSWRRPEWLRRCLEGVATQDPAPERVIVIGRVEDTPTREVVDSFPGVEWRPVDQAGFVAPIRVGAREVTSPLFAVIDDDGEPAERSWLKELTAAFEDPLVACVGSHVSNQDGVRRRVRRSSGLMRWFGHVGSNVSARTDSLPVEVVTLPEGNWAWRSDVFRTLEIDPIFDAGDAVLYSCDLIFQAVRHGWKALYTSRAPIIHHLAPRQADESVRRNDHPRAAFGYARNATYIVLKHRPWRICPFLLWSVLVGNTAVPGILSTGRDVLRRRSDSAVVAASVRGRAAGIRYWLANRRRVRATTRLNESRPDTGA
jgi:GT2 family glycosyltransferase